MFLSRILFYSEKRSLKRESPQSGPRPGIGPAAAVYTRGSRRRIFGHRGGTHRRSGRRRPAPRHSGRNHQDFRRRPAGAEERGEVRHVVRVGATGTVASVTDFNSGSAAWRQPHPHRRHARFRPAPARGLTAPPTQICRAAWNCLISARGHPPRGGKSSGFKFLLSFKTEIHAPFSSPRSGKQRKRCSAWP